MQIISYPEQETQKNLTHKLHKVQMQSEGTPLQCSN